MSRQLVDRATARRVAWDVLERLEDLADRAGELLGAIGLALLGAAVLLEGVLEVLAVLLAFGIAFLLAVLPRVREFLETAKPRAIRWYLGRS